MRAFALVILMWAGWSSAENAAAAESHFGPIGILIPQGFEGPYSQKLAAGAEVAAFRKPHSADSFATLLEITTYDLGNVPPMSDDALLKGDDKYLSNFIAGIERRRTDFSVSPIVHLRIANIPAAKLSWQGKLDGLPSNGVMYSIIVGHDIVVIHTQDAGAVPTVAMQQAIHAIESLRVATPI